MNKLTGAEIRQLALDLGAEKCGIAGIDRFSSAPPGYNPADIYAKCRSVVVFLRSMPPEIILADDPIPYTHSAYLLYAEIDRLGLQICRALEERGVHAIPIPCDVPYRYWDAEKNRGQGILSLRHAAYLAGLGILGKNTLLMNRDLGNMVYIGAVLVDATMEPDPIATDFACPPRCRVCLETCPQQALDGTAVEQDLCRKKSFVKTGRGFDLYACNLCRRSCPNRLGYGKRGTARSGGSRKPR